MMDGRRIRIVATVIITAVSLLAVSGVAVAHFGMVIPSDDVVTQSEGRTITLRVMFAHPFEGDWMDMAKPVKFGIIFRGKDRRDLLKTLKPFKIKEHQAWQSDFKLGRPGDYVFYAEPQPYWEPAEETFIIHYTKVVVNAFGLEEGWDKEVGLKTEIIPLTRPYGLYTGNVFRGLVKVNGKHAPFTEVEVEYYNEKGRYEAPASPFVTQVIKTDQNGLFTYAMPMAGWWGFAALSEDTRKLKHEGKEYPVEIGAVMWVRVYDMKEK